MPATRSSVGHRLGFRVAVGVLLVVAVVSVLAPVLPLPDYAAMGPQRLLPPSAEAWVGTDQFGRDILSRLVWGMRTSIVVAGLAVVGAALIGVPLGLAAASQGGMVDAAIMRSLDALFAFPTLLLAIGISAVVGPGAVTTIVALSIVGIPQMARIVRGAAMVEVRGLYVDAARAIGVGNAPILVRHVLPNVLGPTLVQSTLFFAIGILTEAGLSFLGFGVQVPLSSLGSMLKDARAFVVLAPWYAIMPGLCITCVVFALNVVADGLSERWNPRR